MDPQLARMNALVDHPKDHLEVRMRNLRVNSGAVRLFLLSFLLLYLELVFIRWLSSYVLYLGYFTNFVLLGALLGIGAGVLLSGKERRLVGWLPLLLILFVTLILLTRAKVDPYIDGAMYFTSTTSTIQLPAYILLPLIFIGVTVIFTVLSQDLGELLNRFKPLKAYNLNILGSLAGIACFTLFSFLALPAWAWFLTGSLLLVPFLPRDKTFVRNLILLGGVVLIVGASDYAYQNIWSPYYRLNLLKVTNGQVSRVGPQPSGPAGDLYNLKANGAGHQEFTSLENGEAFYQLPYNVFSDAPEFQNVLVIGAGGGNDVATALAHSVRHIDAVEIDPDIVALGKTYHPEQPYSDPRVSVYIDDARAFLEKTDTRYDLVIYALPDSLVLASNMSNLRLESFLFTSEAFQSVRNHLAPDGLFVLYNYYRSDWLIEKIVSMLNGTFDQQAVYYTYLDPEYQQFGFVTIFAGPKTAQLDMTNPGLIRPVPQSYAPASDNWPFLYMKAPSLPAFYGLALALILMFSFIYVWRLAPQGAISRFGWPFFFMGCAFTLLESKSIVQLILLFGSTWLVNSLVFFAILLVVLVANWIVARYPFKRMWILYTLLFVSLALSFAVPLKSLLSMTSIVRYILAAGLLFSPIFFANLIYSSFFRDTEQANVAFGANLLGTMVGGAAEYLALYFGYQNLVLFAAVFYLCAFYLALRWQKHLAAVTAV
jgi:spermidine synthase